MDPPVYFVTICVPDRRPVLTTGDRPMMLRAVLREAATADGWCVGRYVLMPDHLHFFCVPTSHHCGLSGFVGRFKAVSTRRAWTEGLKGALWQKEFFDHLLRSDESYDQKWDYVRRNPVRAGLSAEPDDWPHEGELAIL